MGSTFSSEVNFLSSSERMQVARDLERGEGGRERGEGERRERSERETTGFVPFKREVDLAPPP